MIIESALDLRFPDVFLELSGFLPDSRLYLKIEAMNLAGSIKFKPALAMIDDLEQRGLLRPGSRVIESSSGNLGIALSIVCNARGYQFTCVTDKNTAPATIELMRAYGARVVVIDKRDPNGGYLSMRLAYLQDRIRADPMLVWPNQYANPINTMAHYHTTAAEILQQFPEVDAVFVGAGTTGTLTGCAQYFARHRPQTRVFAVDIIGSTTFGTPPGRRHIPGLGTSRTPAIASLQHVTDLVMVSEHETVKTCRRLRDRHHVLVGGSTGAVLTGVADRAALLRPGSVVVAISPDLGDRYAGSLYNPAWVAERELDRPPAPVEPLDIPVPDLV
ncbi:cysteine synthase [Actinoplanes sp. SE50]|uniref:2,3-diaminopropionate biosynthesis protein SbnA n=1 Tax=unclassified Actinoplanes TaxID=2626549 RepID=UPI00023EC3D4|nr:MULTISPECIES: 2,3-diaminopropionate biosynthesis protein SbnA [unclassified Actinoplanes]AEV81897.1 cysteine synthase A [Actinoplanes sp. SE50/110]ATO80298.1 cysteine synthase [Actinoplanes sp. SE50]SLL97703.1 2,3-diaminopropionate biosynthesis protein SbnA [Actinoplanes sp. SE50/110]